MNLHYFEYLLSKILSIFMISHHVMSFCVPIEKLLAAILALICDHVGEMDSFQVTAEEIFCGVGLIANCALKHVELLVECHILFQRLICTPT